MAVVADQVVVEDTAAEDVEQDRSPKPDPSRRTVLAIWGLVIALIAVIGLLAGQGGSLLQAKQDQNRDRQVLDVTREVVAGLVSLDYQRSKADMDRIKAVSTGAFAQQFDQLAASFEQVLSSGEVRSTGSVKEAGIVHADDDSAEVLAAVSSIVKNTEAPDGQQRVYRMKVDLERSGDDWKVSNVEFVS